MTTRYRVPAELRKEYMLKLRGLDLIEQCHHEISTTCDDENFWKEKIHIDYTIAPDNTMYTEYEYTPYQWYVLLTYALKYYPGLLDTYDNNGKSLGLLPIEDSPISEVVFEFLNDTYNQDFLPRKAFENQEDDLIDVYMHSPEIPLTILFNTRNEAEYRRIYRYVWDNYPGYHNVLKLLDIIKIHYNMFSYWPLDNCSFDISSKDLLGLIAAADHHSEEFPDRLADIYRRQFEQPENDPELCSYLENLQARFQDE